METEIKVIELKHDLEVPCTICRKALKRGQRAVLVPIQMPAGDFVINAVCLVLHEGCHFVKKTDGDGFSKKLPKGLETKSDKDIAAGGTE